MPRDWDEHYRDPANLDFTPAALLVELAGWMPPGRALDLACGTGRHALHLAQLGWQVTAVDASPVALGVLRQKSRDLPIQIHLADLEGAGFTIEAGRYDLICDFFYLQRDLFPAIREGIRPGGVFAGAMHLSGAFHLEPEELRREFAGWKILYYSEGGEPGRSRQTAKILARKA
ncbi:Methyltransferase type 12 [Candidatus Sulfopaludibacter sp. SbA3]|nr:Methyltransferase type 12 [Candidatus Sulfopaludibacter sp. SbA3]